MLMSLYFVLCTECMYFLTLIHNTLMEYDQTVKRTNFTLGILHSQCSPRHGPHALGGDVSPYIFFSLQIFFKLWCSSGGCDGRAATELGEVFHCKLAAGRRGRG